ncbi:MAG: hypothetical protein KGI33_02455 [Thaumarchaeota archaeon]|nr:hypothetical protein [Nitrososphaerota archaeon]
MDSIRIYRDLDPGEYSIEDVFVGLKGVEIIRKVFSSDGELEEVFFNTKLILDTTSHYMHVKNEDATIVVGLDHLRNSDTTTLYLDIIHELVHVRQQRLGLDLYDESYSYVDRPTEIEAYKVAVGEAKRLGLLYDQIMDYLRVEWISPEEHHRLASHVGLVP